MCFNILFFLFFDCFIIYSGYSQSSNYSIGGKIGFGVTIPNSNPNLIYGGNSFELRCNGFYSGGIVGQYLLANKIGIESGVLTTLQSYSRKDLVDWTVKNYLGWNSIIDIIDHQIPIQIIYKINHPTNPYKKFNVTAGISLDWLKTEYLKQQQNSLFMSNVLVGVRIEGKKGKHGKIVYGFEYQYSLDEKYEFKVLNNTPLIILKPKYNVLSFNLYYFILNRYL